MFGFGRWLGLSGAIALAGCGGHTAAQGGPSSDFTQLKLQAWEGFGPGCSVTPEVITLVNDTRALSWTICNFTGSSTPPTTGARTITQAELDAISADLAQVKPSNAVSCGADAGIVALDVTNAVGAQGYVDDFYSGCPSDVHKGRTFVTGLNELWNTTASIAQR